MRSNYFKATLEAAIFAVTVLLLTAGFASAQSVVNLTAAQQTTVLPDGATVPMWGWTCGGVTGNPVTTAATGGATCTSLTYTAGALNPQTNISTWQPPLIVVPYVATGTGTSLTINLTNTLPVETSLVVIGQTGGGIGGATGPVREAGPRTDGAHAGQTATTWTIVVPTGGFTPPTQGERARTFSSIEVPGVATVGGAVAAPGGYTYSNLQPGTYLIRTGTYPSIQGPMGLYGVLVVTVAPAAGAAGLAYPVPAGQVATGVHYDADVVALESEIDARQNGMVAALFPVGGAAGSSTTNVGFSETMKWTSQCGAATNSLLTATGAVPTCYPPAVDYTPKYFLINGLAFSKDNRAASALPITVTPTTAGNGNVLVRYVNAGSHMHVPTVNGLNMLLVAEDGFVLPDISLAIAGSKLLTANNPPAAACTTCAVGLRIQDEVFQPAGKVFDVLVSPPVTAATYATWDRSLALGTNSQRDGGMQAILDVNDSGGAKLGANSIAVAVNDTYAYAPTVTLKVTDPGKGVIANDMNVYGVQLLKQAGAGTVTLFPNGTFTYVPTGSGTDSFTYCANGTVTAAVCSSGVTATVTLNMSATANAANAPTANPDTFTSKSASLMRVSAPGVLFNDTDPNGYALTAVIGTPSGVTVNLAADGSFTASPTTAGTCGPPAGCTFTYTAKNSQAISSAPAKATLIFQPGSGLIVRVQDAKDHTQQITDYKWIIEQDLTLHIDPACQVNTGGGARPTGSNGLPCPALPAGQLAPDTPATQFHASFYPVVASGCTGPQSCGQGQTVYDANPASPTFGQHVKAACDGYGICTIGANQLPASMPSDAVLDALNPDGTPASYYISILSGDSANAFNTANVSNPYNQDGTVNTTNCAAGTEPTGISISSKCGHTMGGSPIPAPVAGVFAPVTVNLELEPLRTATVTAFIFEDDYPLNGEPNGGGGIDVIATLEPGLGDFQFEIWDDAGGIGDFTGQMTYDTFNVPLTNSLNGTIDPATGFNACPISTTSPGVGIGVIVVCPQFESDGKTLSPLTGQAVVRNLMQGKYSLIAHPGAAREAAGEEWLQTNSLDGGHFLDAFLRVGEPAYFQEFGPGGYHVFMGMANPKIINARLAAICNPSASNPPPAGTPFALPCNNNVNGQVTNLHQGRSPNENLFSGGVFAHGDARNYAPLTYTNCYAAIGDSDGATIALAKCDPDGNFKFTNLPAGNYGVVIFDQWDDFIVDGSSRPVNISGGTTQTLTFPTFTWQTHLWSRSYMDVGGLGAPVLLPDGSLDPIASPGLIQVPTKIRQRNGKFVNTLLSDITGTSRFDETFPLFAFYTVESDTTRFRGTGVHVVNDAGGPVDTTGPYAATLNSKEAFPLPAALQYPGSVYCATADCPNGFAAPTGTSTGRVDPGNVVIEGWQGGVSEFDMIDWGKTPYIPGENGGIRGHVVYTSTRPFDDPRMNFQNLWDPLVPRVTINLYKEGTAPDGSTSLTLVDTTQSSSWDDWAQGFRADGVTPNMSCTGQDPADPFFSYTLAGTRNYLRPNTPLPNNSQYKCYDGYHNLNQLQPAPYDGLYQFPSATCLTPGATFTLTGNTTAYHCATIPNPAFGLAGAAGTGAATAILPPGKYVTEVILPPNWELNKEEDLNLLIGDQYIAPAVTQFGVAGLGNIYITPDQASIDAANPSYTGPYTAANPYNQPFSNCTTPGVASTCTFTPNTTNNGKQAGDYGRSTFGSFGPGGVIQQNAPCVGLARIVPDYLSISPESGEVAPFAGVTKNLCDRKEVTLDDTMQANADFFIWTKVAKAVTFTGFISDDFSSEFDPASPAFGEKFAIPNVPVSIKDFDGVEVSRLYSDQWGTYNGLTYGSWEVNVPNITGYSPNMMITCMNDPGPIPDPLHAGQLITDPLYNPAYSNFCYENPFMPGDATYLDTPVVPTSAFAEGYNPPDCAYPDTTPAIKSVTGSTSGGGAGPWLNSETASFTITALGDTVVPNNAYSGPAANSAPYNLKFVTRHYGFGAGAKVRVGGVAATCGSGDLSMTCNLPATPLLPLCALQQVGYLGARCGEVVITAANGKQSVDAVTLTIGGKAPSYVAGENAKNNAIQTAIDTATSGDLIIVGPGTYNELVLMWKPVRLQGVGAASVTINASAHPAGKLDSWRRQVNCLFGLAINGQPYSTPGNLVPLPSGGGSEPLNVYDPTGASSCPGTGWNSFAGGPNNPQVDRLPLEGIVGWDTTVNGNLAELLQEPSLMGAYEGAGITVLGKGVRYPAGLNIFGSGQDTAAGSFIAHESQMPVPTIELTNSTSDCHDYPSNFQCNPSRIDGITITNSSQGGGGIFVHAWGHNLEIANNRIYSNGGTLTGGISVGQGESGDALLSGNGGNPIGYNGGTLAGFDQQPWTCLPGAVVATTATPYGYDQVVSPPGTYFNQQLPYCFNLNVQIHNNSITSNAAYGDELFSATPAGGGGVTLSTGSDSYDFNYNWVCGNLSTGDGGGLAHLGFSWNGDISHNSFLFNQSFNPTLTAHGGGAVVMGAAPDGAPLNAAAGTECGSVTDIDCAPGLSDGVGPGLRINANLFQGNTAESGSGGGLRLQTVNGTDVQRFPSNPLAWYEVSVTNNIFANNVAGWTGGGVSLQDALKVNFVNNTVVSNDSTATAGVLFDTLGAPEASVPPAGCDPRSNPNCTGFQVTQSNFQPAGLATAANTTLLSGTFPAGFTGCPVGHPLCNQFSNPMLHNNIFWQNRAFRIVPDATTGAVQLHPALTQTATPASANGVITGGTGACATTGPLGESPYYWDIGVYNDTAPNNHASGLTLSPDWSVLTDAADYPSGHNIGSNPNVVSQYCDGSRVPAEIATQLCSGAQGNANAPGCIQPGTVGVGTTVPGGVPDSVPPPLPLFTLTPAATVDEGSNWINMFYGPLSLSNPTLYTAPGSALPPLGNYALNGVTGSPAIDYVPSTVGHPLTDFFGNPRPDPSNVNLFDIGAIEFQGGVTASAPTLASIAPSSGLRGTSLGVTLTGTNLLDAQLVTLSGAGVNCTVTGSTSTTANATCAITAGAALGARSVTVTTAVGTSPVNPAVMFTVLGPTLTSITPASALRGTINVTLTGTGLTGATWSTGTTSGYPNITFGPLTVNVAGTQATASLTISAATTLGVKNFSVTTPIGTTNTVTFTVVGPTLTSIAPTSGLRGTSVPVTLTGTNLTGATAVNAPGSPNITVTNFAAVNGTTVTATLNVAAATALGPHNITVSTPGGTSNAVTFTVVGPTLTSISPTSGIRGTTVPVTLTGTNLAGATGLTGLGTGVSVAAGTFHVVSSTSVTATLNIATGTAAPLGARSIAVVTASNGTSNTGTFTVFGPTLTSIGPNSATHPTSGTTSVPVTLTGTNLTGATALTGLGTGVSVAAGTFQVVSSTSVTATLNIASTATTGISNIAVATTSNGPSNTVTFTVN